VSVYARRRAVALAALALVLTALVAGLGMLRASGAGAAGEELVVQPSQGAPTLAFLGASPGEVSGEVWAVASGGGSGTKTLARYTDAGGWEIVPEPTAVGGGQIPGLTLFSDASAGRTTPRGGVIVAGREEDELGERRGVLVVRDPGGSLRQAGDPSPLLFGDQLFGFANPDETGRLLAATDEAGGKTGAFVVPGARVSVLHYDGSGWSEEPICVEVAPVCAAPAAMQVEAIDAADGEAWLVGSSASAQGIELFRRETGLPGGPAWVQQQLGPSGSIGARYAEEKPFGVTVAARTKGQPLTVTGSGVWIDAQLGDGSGSHDATLYFDIGKGEVTGSWCDLASAPGLCLHPLGSELPSGQGRSFAWPPSGSSGQFGTRAITGVGQGAILSLEGLAFRRLTFVGGDAGSEEGAALSSPEEGWLGAQPPLQLTRNPQVARLQQWPVPFKRPLTAIAPQPGAPVAGLDSEALAVGDEGQVARYLPGRGWEPEFLIRGNGKRATPTLRGVAWPEEGRAYAVGDGAAMWRWQKATELWQPDPGAPQNLARANFTGIAFDPDRPSRGYAIGKQGVLLGFGREWKQETLPPGVPAEANFTSIAFAGDEALITYKIPENGNRYKGGVIVNDGSGWRLEPLAQQALAGAVPQRVAGLPDGGAVIASLTLGESSPGTGKVIERQGPGAAWQVAAGGAIGYPTALAAIREGGQVRAIVSIAPTQGEAQGNIEFGSDLEQVNNQPPPGQAPLLTAPYKLPGAGLLVRQTATGWRDEQREGFPPPGAQQAGQNLYDLPAKPDPILALSIAPDGSGGWAVGGETGTLIKFRAGTAKTAGVLRYGSGATAPPNAASAPIQPVAGTATFAVGAGAQCAAACADFAGAGIGPDRWLRAAVGRASGIAGIRAFLYAGASVADTAGASGSETPLAEAISAGAFEREQQAYARRAGSNAGSMPVYAAPDQSDIDAAGTLATFTAAFGDFPAPFGSGAAPAGIAGVSQAGPGQAYYSFDSSGSGGAVRVVVLDYSRPTLGDGQRCWLAQQLSGARAAARPAIVVGARDLANLAPNAAEDRAAVIQTLVGAGAPGGCALPAQLAGASAYFFDFPEQNRAYRLSSSGRSLPAYGSGTLGYVTPPAPTNREFAGASGFLLVSVDVGGRDPATNVAPVGAQLVPSIGALALEATDGTLLRRSQPALFQALARRPLAGSQCQSGTSAVDCELVSPEPYVPIPSQCQGANCSTSVFPEYTFTSSEPDIADFVSPDPASTNPRNVQLVKGKPVLNSHSGLLCAFNSGTTIVTVSTGGLSYSQKVTVQAGSVQRPCGTTPRRNRNPGSPEPDTPPEPLPNEKPVQLENETPPPPPPPPAAPAPSPLPAPAKVQPPPPPPPTYFPIPAIASAPLVPIVPPPPLPAVQPTPPSGTSQVQAVEEEEEPEEAYEASSAMAALPAPGPARANLALSASRDGNGGVPLLLPALILVAAVAAAAIGGSTNRRRPGPAFASTKHNRRYR